MAQETQVGLGPGSRIKQAREAAGLTQAALGADLGVAARTVQSWELDEREPRKAVRARLALRLGKPVSWFYEQPEKVA